MSAECSKCGHDLDMDYWCISCAYDDRKKLLDECERYLFQACDYLNVSPGSWNSSHRSMKEKEKTCEIQEFNKGIMFGDEELNFCFLPDGDLEITVEGHDGEYKSIFLEETNTKQLVDWLVEKTQAQD